MLLGVHCSISGGMQNAFYEAESLGIDTFQIFTKNQRQWKEKTINAGEKSMFLNSLKNLDIKIIFSHASYLINLAGDNNALWERSITALTSEIQRCHELGLKFTVLHPGYTKGLSEKEGIKKTIKALKTVLNATKNSNVKNVPPSPTPSPS
ncbi:MAG: TIM barrel protein, partial [Planctomycetota bacterium]